MHKDANVCNYLFEFIFVLEFNYLRGHRKKKKAAHTNVRDVRDVMSGMYGWWCVALNISAGRGQNLIKLVSLENLSSILNDN